ILVPRYLFVLIEVCFFFSCRRRHTRSKRDWSSDVCSSDLSCFCRLSSECPWPRLARVFVDSLSGGSGKHVSLVTSHTESLTTWRSEERRVGKECRPGFLRVYRKKKM